MKGYHLLDNLPANDIDGHNDFLSVVRDFYKDDITSTKFKQDFENGPMFGHVDLPRLKQGKSAGAFWSLWRGCPANVSDFSDDNYEKTVNATYGILDLAHRLQLQYPNIFTPTTDSTAALQAFKDGRYISPVAIEGLHQIGNSAENLRQYFRMGVRYATLTHNCHNKYADAALIEVNRTVVKSTPLWQGVSHEGIKLIEEMNRMGMIVDLSHVSRDTMIDVLNGSTVKGWTGALAPPIFSHSSAHAICPHPRNVEDDVLQLVKKHNSIVMVNFAPEFISCTSSNSSRGVPGFFPANSTVTQVVRHIKHIGDLIGYDHVGVGSDFDGIPTTPQGLEDVSKFPALVAEMLRQGITDRDAAKVIGWNILRVWAEVDRVAHELQNL